MLRHVDNKVLATLFDVGVGILIVVGVWMVMASIQHEGQINDLRGRVDDLDTKYYNIVDSVGRSIIENQKKIIANQDSIKTILRAGY